MRIYALIPKLSSDSVAFIYSSSASVSLSLLFFSRPHRPSPIKVPGEVVTDGEKSKAGKKRAKAPWAKPLSQYSQFMRNEFSCLHVRFFYSFLPTKLRNDAQSPKAYTTEDYLKITEEQLKASSPGKSQREDQIQTQELAVQSQPEVKGLRRRTSGVGCLVKLLRRRTSGVLVILIPVHVNLAEKRALEKLMVSCSAAVTHDRRS
ncbi:hypothetical protein IGI04_011363 [Brassica rapa subsp. trilocularis]|uniref:Uncharacterized protein n=1 Tax=Brassica rapa subsp. trilocularis TaxID=1813537 RepID=A0ABQ7N2U7_BRACM|nr:hypothetical protein IGI04_011363 [Brassica rapa subsp. trilocularis]